MKTTNLTIAILTATGLCVAGATAAQPMNKDAREMAIKNAEAQYKVDKAACDAMSGNAKDICFEDAKGKEKVAKADADAAYENTPKAREAARVARADRAYAVAKEKCDDLTGNPKDVCVKEAKAAHVRATADAKVDRVSGDAHKDSANKTAEAQHDAAVDKRDADYDVAAKKCDALVGSAKDTCVKDAKVRFGKM